MNRIEIPLPDDAHLHLRDEDALPRTVADTARTFGRAVVMPNLVPPVTTVEAALSYRSRILAHAPSNQALTPLMTLYLTDNTSPETVREAAACEHVVGFKLYPAGATTNSDSGVTNLDALDATFAAMAEEGVLLLVHGEVTHDDVDIFARERVFLDDVLRPLLARHPALRCVLEHVTTADGVAFVQEHAEKSPGRMAGTLTPHHLHLNRNALLVGGIHPHNYCLPVLKSERHRKALVEAALDDSAFFLGTDSAPHAIGKKECAHGCAGIYNAPCAVEATAEIFAAHDRLENLAAFTSERFCAFYGLPAPTSKVVLTKEAHSVPESLAFGDSVVVPFRAGVGTAWTCQRLD